MLLIRLISLVFIVLITIINIIITLLNNRVRADITLKYHTKVDENVSNHAECFNNCLETRTFKCVASEMYDGKCYLFDKNFKMSFYRNSTVYFGTDH